MTNIEEEDYLLFPLQSAKGNFSGKISGKGKYEIGFSNLEVNPTIGGVTGWYEKTDYYANSDGKVDLPISKEYLQDTQIQTSYFDSGSSYKRMLDIGNDAVEFIRTYLRNPFVNIVENAWDMLPTRY